jgi:CopG family nickel-responsive transcriptional regulator
MTRVKRISVSLPQDLFEEFEKAIRRKAYVNRSKALADVIREYLANLKIYKEEKEGIGTITILYDHKTRGVVDRLISIQHDHGKIITSGLHVHLDESNCLEVIVAKGIAKEIESLANSLIRSRGVKHGKLVITSLD